MFHQLLVPVFGNLFLSFLVGSIPILVVLILLGVLRRPAWQAALAGLVVGLIIAIRARLKWRSYRDADWIGDKCNIQWSGLRAVPCDVDCLVRDVAL